MRKKAKKNFFFEKRKSKWPTQKNNVIQNHQFSKIFRENFTDWSLGSVGLIDAKGIDEAVMLADINSKTGKKCFFRVFLAIFKLMSDSLTANIA